MGKGVRELSGEMGIFYDLNSGCAQIVKNGQTDVYILWMFIYEIISHFCIIILYKINKFKPAF